MAGNYFSTRRSAEFSVIDDLTAKLDASWNNPTIPVVKAFLQSYNVPVPVICVRMTDVNSFRREIGGDSLRQQYTFIVDIFAKSDGQRIDLAEFVVQAIKSGCVFYNYSHSSGSRETLDKVANGRLTLLTIDADSRVEFGGDNEEHDKFRHSITFTME